MQLTISGHHVDLTEALETYVKEKLQRLARHSDGIIQANVILSVEQKIGHKAEAILHIKGTEIFAEQIHDDMYAAIDTLIDKLDRQLLKHKEKQLKRRA